MPTSEPGCLFGEGRLLGAGCLFAAEDAMRAGAVWQQQSNTESLDSIKTKDGYNSSIRAISYFLKRWNPKTGGMGCITLSMTLVLHLCLISSCSGARAIAIGASAEQAAAAAVAAVMAAAAMSAGAAWSLWTLYQPEEWCITV